MAKRIAELIPDLFITLSSDVAPQIREFPRASTATVNAYTMPISQPYLRNLSERLARRGFPNSPLIMLSSGGVVGADTAGRNPGAHDRERPGGRRARRLPLLRCARHRPADVVRHGRHDRQGLPDRGPRAADHRRCSRSIAATASRKAAGCPVTIPVDRHDRDRRRRRLHRRMRRARAAQGRPAKARAPRPVPPATAAAARSRRSPTPTSCSACSTPTTSSAAT